MILNDEQKLAVYNNDKFIFLMAGAGSGKTRVIIEKIKYLINKGISEDKILCITFTNKSTNEMKKRLGNLNIDTYTFHSYCYDILIKEKTFKIFEYNNEFTQNEILKISNYKNSLYKAKKPKIYDTYKNYLDKRNLIDFDDLMIEAINYVHKHTYEYIFIDEFQDTNLLQFELLRKMINEKTNVFAVGDPDQSIYAFRGARGILIKKYLDYFNATLLKLEKNYRSDAYILDASNNLIKKNINRFNKRLNGIHNHENKPKIYIGSHEKIENKIISMIKENKDFDAVVLFRNHYQVSKLKQLMIRNYLFNVNFFSFHEAKGLEFKSVYIIGLEELPYDKENIYKNKEEERRLLFVAMTRAMKNLYIFSTKKTGFIKEMKIDIINM